MSFVSGGRIIVSPIGIPSECKQLLWHKVSFMGIRKTPPETENDNATLHNVECRFQVYHYANYIFSPFREMLQTEVN